MTLLPSYQSSVSKHEDENENTSKNPAPWHHDSTNSRYATNRCPSKRHLYLTSMLHYSKITTKIQPLPRPSN